MGLIERIALLTVIFSVANSISDNLDLFEAKGCDAGDSAYCLDCKTYGSCTPPATPLTACSSESVCREISSFATCDSPANVPDCSCPPTGTFAKPDPYTDTKYVLCVEGTAHYQSCKNETTFNPVSLKCEQPITTQATTVIITTTTPSPCTSICDGTDTVEQVDCFAYCLCLEDGAQYHINCEPAEIFDPEIEKCITYPVFSCADYPVDNFYGDPANCSIYYLCIDSQQVGDPLVCDEGTLFDSTTHTCVPDAELQCKAVGAECNICTNSESSRIPIDCNSYYQCTNSTSGYNPVKKTCPPGYYYDPVNEYCSPTVAGCPEVETYIKNYSYNFGTI